MIKKAPSQVFLPNFKFSRFVVDGGIAAATLVIKLMQSASTQVLSNLLGMQGKSGGGGGICRQHYNTYFFLFANH